MLIAHLFACQHRLWALVQSETSAWAAATRKRAMKMSGLAKGGLKAA
jgi:hypothetical protein